VSPDAGRASEWLRWASDRTRELVLFGAALLGVLLALFAIGRLGRGVSAVLEQKEATFGESILYDHAARIVRGEPLYQPLDRPPYSVAPYTPLYYGFAAALQALFGPGFPPGRLLSLLAGLAAAALIGRLTARRAGSRWAGAFAACLFLTLGFPGRIPFFALYKEDMLGVALSLAAISTLSEARSARRLALAAALAALAILTKQTMASAAVAGTVWLFQEDRRRAVRFAGICLGIVLATAIALEILTGAFFQNALSANAVPFRWDAFGPNLETLVRFQAIPIVLSVLYVVDRARSGRRPRTDLLVLYFAVCVLTVIGMGRPGSAHNYWMELAGATSMLATLAVWERLDLRATLGKQIRSAIPLLLLGANVAYIFVPMRSAVVPVLSFLKTAPQKEPDFDRLIERVRSEPRKFLPIRPTSSCSRAARTCSSSTSPRSVTAGDSGIRRPWSSGSAAGTWGCSPSSMKSRATRAASIRATSSGRRRSSRRSGRACASRRNRPAAFSTSPSTLPPALRDARTVRGSAEARFPRVRP
jgi:predicted small integral membrane protein